MQPTFYSENDISPEEFTVLQKLAKDAGDDAFVLITPSEQPSEQNQIHTRRGYGMVQRSMFGLTRTYLYNLIRVGVYDTASGKQLGWSKAYSALTGAPPQKYLEDWNWQESFISYTPEQQAGLKADAELMTDPAIIYSISDMGL